MKKSIVYVLIVVAILSSCSDDEVRNDAYHKEVIDYFKEVALGFEFGSATKVTRKWDQDMKIFVGGEPTTELQNELTRIINEINGLTSEDDFEISITTDSLQSNSYVFFGAGSDFAKWVPFAESDIASNWGLFYVFFDGDDHIYRSVVYVDIFRATESAARKHLLREELTQSLGLARDSFTYPESIFQQGWTTVTEYAPIDRELIRLLYNPAMSTGLDATEVEAVLDELLKKLNI